MLGRPPPDRAWMDGWTANGSCRSLLCVASARPNGGLVWHMHTTVGLRPPPCGRPVWERQRLGVLDVFPRLARWDFDKHWLFIRCFLERLGFWRGASGPAYLFQDGCSEFGRSEREALGRRTRLSSLPRLPYSFFLFLLPALRRAFGFVVIGGQCSGGGGLLLYDAEEAGSAGKMRALPSSPKQAEPPE